MRRLAALLVALSGPLGLATARADGLAPAGPVTQGQCYASGTSGPRVPCVLQGQTWTRVLRPTDPASDMPVAVPGAPLARTAAQRANEVVNAADYFTCDGATDIGVGLQAAVAAATPSRPLYLSPQPGACLTSRNMQPASGVTIYATPGTFKLQPTPASPADPLLFLAVGKTGITVSGMTIDGGGANYPNERTLFTSYASSKIVIDNMDVANARGIPFNLSNSDNSGVKNSKFNNIGNYWRADPSGSASLTSKGRNQAIAFCCSDVRPSADNFVINNKFIDVGLDDISMGSGSRGIISGNSCYHANPKAQYSLNLPDYPACVYLSNMTDTQVTGNTAIGAYGNGFDLNLSTGLTVTGNIATGNGSAGIGVFSDYVTISGNTVLNNNQAGYTNPVNCLGGICISREDGVPRKGISVSGNMSGDIQTTKTQNYGIYATPGTTFVDTYIDQSNVLSGNKTAPLGGKITAFGAQ